MFIMTVEGKNYFQNLGKRNKKNMNLRQNI